MAKSFQERFQGRISAFNRDGHVIQTEAASVTCLTSAVSDDRSPPLLKKRSESIPTISTSGSQRRSIITTTSYKESIVDQYGSFGAVTNAGKRGKDGVLRDSASSVPDVSSPSSQSGRVVRNHGEASEIERTPHPRTSSSIGNGPPKKPSIRDLQKLADVSSHSSSTQAGASTGSDRVRVANPEWLVGMEVPDVKPSHHEDHSHSKHHPPRVIQPPSSEYVPTTTPGSKKGRPSPLIPQRQRQAAPRSAPVARREGYGRGNRPAQVSFEREQMSYSEFDGDDAMSSVSAVPAPLSSVGSHQSPFYSDPNAAYAQMQMNMQMMGGISPPAANSGMSPYHMNMMMPQVQYPMQYNQMGQAVPAMPLSPMSQYDPSLMAAFQQQQQMMLLQQQQQQLQMQMVAGHAQESAKDLLYQQAQQLHQQLQQSQEQIQHLQHLQQEQHTSNRQPQHNSPGHKSRDSSSRKITHKQAEADREKPTHMERSQEQDDTDSDGPSVHSRDGYSNRNRNRDINFQPYTLNDYLKSKPNKYQVLGKLGPDLSAEELIKKRATVQKVREFSKNLREINDKVKLPPSSQRRPRSEGHTSSVSTRQRALDFARNIPKPKVKLRADVDDEYIDEGATDRNHEEDQSPLEMLEMQHRQNQAAIEALRREFGVMAAS